MPISPYLASLRDHVGHARLLAPAASIAPVRDGHVLLAQSAETGEWQTLGGMIEPLEHPADGARREAFEEAGILINPTRLIGVFGGPDAEVVYPNGDIVAYTVIAFAGEIEDDGRALRADGAEIKNLDWFDKEAIDVLPIAPFNRRIARLALDPTAPPLFEPAQYHPEA